MEQAGEEAATRDAGRTARMMGKVTLLAFAAGLALVPMAGLRAAPTSVSGPPSFGRFPTTRPDVDERAQPVDGAPAAAAMSPAAKAGAETWAPRPAAYGVHEQRNVRITMSDGARMTASVLRPAAADGSPAGGRFPVILTQTSYTEDADRNDYLIQRGYVQVIAFARGSGASEGHNTFGGTREQLDGYELVQWAASQPWSNGRVAVYGASFMALYSLLTAAQQPPALRAAFPMTAPGDTYRDIIGPGGQYNAGTSSLGILLAPPMSLIPPGWAGEDPANAAALMASHAVAPATYQVPNTVNFVSGDDLAYDGPNYWSRSPLHHVDRIKVPTFLVGGWFDLFQRGDPLLFEELQKRRVPVKLVMGPWDHLRGPWSGPASSDPEWTQRLSELALRWFDHHVQGVPDPGLRSMPGVTYHRLISASWETAGTWPPAHVTYRKLYLGGPAGPLAPGVLGDTPAPESEPDTLVWQPAAGVCSRTTGGGFADVPGCTGDQRHNSMPSLAYDKSVDRDLDITGPVAARLFVSTNGQDAYLAPRLEAVAPDGTVTHLTAGWQLLSMRALDAERSLRAKATDGDTVYPRPFHPFTRASTLPVEADVVYEVWVELPPIAARIPAGHALRLSIQPSDFPHAMPTAPQATALAGSVARLHHDVTHPSALVLPVG